MNLFEKIQLLLNPKAFDANLRYLAKRFYQDGFTDGYHKAMKETAQAHKFIGDFALLNIREG